LKVIKRETYINRTENLLRMQEKIISGADRLLDYVKTKKRTTVKDAALSLNVSQDAISAWANVLEEHNLIHIKIGLMSTFLETAGPGKNATNHKKNISSYMESRISSIKQEMSSYDRYATYTSKMKQLDADIRKREGFIMDQKKMLVQLRKQHKILVDKQNDIYGKISSLSMAFEDMVEHTLNQVISFEKDSVLRLASLQENSIRRSMIEHAKEYGIPSAKVAEALDADKKRLILALDELREAALQMRDLQEILSLKGMRIQYLELHRMRTSMEAQDDLTKSHIAEARKAYSDIAVLREKISEMCEKLITRKEKIGHAAESMVATLKERQIEDPLKDLADINAQLSDLASMKNSYLKDASEFYS
jgi:hypothetical protein